MCCDNTLSSYVFWTKRMKENNANFLFSPYKPLSMFFMWVNVYFLVLDVIEMLSLWNCLCFTMIFLLDSSLTSVLTLSCSYIKLLKDNNYQSSKHTLAPALLGVISFGQERPGLLSRWTHHSACPIWQMASCCKCLDSDSFPRLLVWVFHQSQKRSTVCFFLKVKFKF